MFKLGSRLTAVVNMIKEMKKVYDIGSDHGYFSIYLLKNKLADKVIVSDVNKAPLGSAKSNLLKYNCVGYEIILSNGFENLDVTDDRECAVIAGMGGELILNIVDEAKKQGKTKKLDYIVLQPMNACEELRKYLYDNGFEILEEDLVKDGKFFYNILKVKDTGNESKVYENNKILYLELGYYLFENKNKLFDKYLEYKMSIEEKILKMCENNDTLSAKKKSIDTKKRLLKFEEIKKAYESK